MHLSLPETRAAWASPEFEATFRRELEAVEAACLPLQQALAFSNAVADEPFHVRLLAAHELADTLVLKVGVLYAGWIAGCQCSDDPTPPSSLTEYCELEVHLDRATAAARVELLA